MFRTPVDDFFPDFLRAQNMVRVSARFELARVRVIGSRLYFWRNSRCFIWWWNTVLNAWYYFSKKEEIEDAKMSSFSSDFQTLIKRYFPLYFLYGLSMSLRLYKCKFIDFSFRTDYLQNTVTELCLHVQTYFYLSSSRNIMRKREIFKTHQFLR